jgi:cytidine deaminase
MSLDALFDAALQGRAHAYAPYSKFQVGAAILADDGHIYFGCNVENAAYPAGTCAEAGVIAAMCAGGGRSITAIAVVGPTAELCFPCGACRQRIREFSTPQTMIHVLKGDSSGHESFDMNALLPRSFGPGDLDGERLS